MYEHTGSTNITTNCYRVRELAIEISLVSLGSNQILRLPHFSTDAANRFWSFKLGIAAFNKTEQTSHDKLTGLTRGTATE